MRRHKRIVYNVNDNSIEEIIPSNSRYDKYMENVEKDFDDMIINTGRPSYVDENVNICHSKLYILRRV